MVNLPFLSQNTAMTTPTETLKIGQISFTWDDINRVVSAFYNEIARDPVLKHPFNTVDDWPHHIERLTHFWWIRFGGTPYMSVSYDPVGKHYETGFNVPFLERWLSLFEDALKKNLTKEQAELWHGFATNIGQALTRNNEMMILRYGKN